MDRRTRQRKREVAVARQIARILNRPLTDETRPFVRLATPKAKRSGEDEDTAHYSRPTITALRPYGRATVYFHGRSRTFRVKLTRAQRANKAKPLLLDLFPLAGGWVSRCAECPQFFARHDARQRYCSPRCADRRRQRRHRHLGRPAAREAFERHQEKMARKRVEKEATVIASPYYRELRAEFDDEAARRLQARLRFLGKKVSRPAR